MVERGKLFVFEGPDGCGKTTLSRAFAEDLSSCGSVCDWFSFPGRDIGTLGRHVYEMHHNPSTAGIKTINPTSLQLLHIAAHIDAIESRILPALHQGRHVVLDRFWWSTVVYGILGGADQQSLKVMVDLERLHWADIYPSRAFLIRRKAPPGESFTLEAGLLRKQYDSLAGEEGRYYPISTIDNDKTLAEALEEVIRIAGVQKQPRSYRKAVPLSEDNNSKRTNHERNPVRPLAVFTKITPAKPSVVYDTFWRFAAERQAVFFRRLCNSPPPWTNDPILCEHKFTNAYRASDRTSQFLIRDVIYKGAQSAEELFFRILLFKIFNRIETWELLIREIGEVSYRTYSFERYDTILTHAIEGRQTIYSAAYIMPSGNSRSMNQRKHRMHLRLLEQMLKDELPARLAEARSMRAVFELLRSYPTIGDFLAYQYTIDLNYSPLLNFSEMDFVVPGPGARDGIRKCFLDLGGLNEAEIIRLIADRQQAEFERLGLTFESLWGRPLQLVDCQSLFCEVDKYARLKHPEVAGHTGRTRIKQKYRLTPKPISHWYPPKWGLNERIMKGNIDVPRV